MMDRSSTNKSNIFHKFYFFLIFVNLFFTNFDLYNNFSNPFIFSSDENVLLLSDGDKYPVFALKRDNLFGRISIRESFREILYIFPCLLLKIISVFIGFIFLFNFELRYLYKKPSCLFSQPPPLNI